MNVLLVYRRPPTASEVNQDRGMILEAHQERKRANEVERRLRDDRRRAARGREAVRGILVQRVWNCVQVHSAAKRARGRAEGPNR